MMKKFETISVIGLGYIGLPTAATLASTGVDVIGVDTNTKVINAIAEGRAHFSEPDLDMLLQSTVSTGKLKAVSTPQEADAFVIAVPTPFHNDKSADLSYVESAGRALAKVLKPGNLVILESTCPVGTTRHLCEWIAEERSDLKLPHDSQNGSDINIAYCPERILPGRMVFELVENDRIIGGMTTKCAERAKQLYELFVCGELHVSDAPTAEIVKLMENAYRDVNIAFANEISVLCDRYDINAWEAIRLANQHPRVNILSPGPGVGGHCIAIDPWFLIHAAPEDTVLMKAARTVNNTKPERVLAKVNRQIERFRKPVIACLGLAYKPDVDDLRESPAIEIVQAIATRNQVELLVVEPNIDSLPDSLNSGKIMLVDVQEAIEKADIILLLVAHKEFAKINPRTINETVVIDTVGLWQKSLTEESTA